MLRITSRWDQRKIILTALVIFLLTGTIFYVDKRQYVLDYFRYCSQFYRVALATIWADRKELNHRKKKLVSYLPYRFSYVKALWSNRGSFTPEEMTEALQLVKGPVPSNWRLNDNPRSEAFFFWQIGASVPAISSLEEHLDSNPLDVRSCYQLGLIYQKVGDIPNSNRLFEKVVEDLKVNGLYPSPSSTPGSVTFGRAFFAVGEQLQQSGNIEEATKHYRLALRYDPWLVQAEESLRDLDQTELKLPPPRVEVKGDLGDDPIIGVAFDDLDVELGGCFYMNYFRELTGWSTSTNLVCNLIYDPAFETENVDGIRSPFWPEDLYNNAMNRFTIVHDYSFGRLLNLQPKKGGKEGFQSIPIPVDSKFRYLQIGFYSSKNSVASIGHRWSSQGTWGKEGYVSYGSSSDQWIVRGEIIQPSANSTHLVIWNLAHGNGNARFDNNILIRLEAKATNGEGPNSLS